MGTLFTRALCTGVVALLLGGCASTQAPKESGFLGDYSRLHKTDAPGGGSRLVYLNPKFTPANYSSVWLEQVVFYPEPQPTQDVPMATLNQIRSYIDSSLRQKLGREVRLVDKPTPGAAHVRIAITAVGTESEALRAYQYIPVALVITGAKAIAQGGRPQEATIAIETSVTDSMTQEVLYAAVRGGTGGEVQSAAQGKGGVQPDNLRPLIDTWTDGAAASITKFVAAR
jgi:hypothetical protein